MPSAWWIAVAVSAALVVSAPFVGDLQRWLLGALGESYVAVVNTAVGAMAAVAIGAAVAGIRERRALRYSLILAAVALAAAYAWRSGLASAQSNAVERFHFVEYGLITWLFYRAVRTVPGGFASNVRHSDKTADLLIAPVACAFVVAMCDEWLQHFAPGRIGEVRDIVMNAAAIACGLLVSAAIVPPQAVRAHGGTRARRTTIVAGTICLVGIGAFVYTVHLGSLIQDEEVAFLSRYDAAALRRRADGRVARGPLARVTEDQYVTEAIWHVQARNALWESGDVVAAWGENRILEKYFAPVLAAGHAWAPEHRADAAQRFNRASQPSSPYRSHAERIPIWTPR